MTTIAIVGAGRGLGGAVARHFGSEGFDVALLPRSQGAWPADWSLFDCGSDGTTDPAPHEHVPSGRSRRPRKGRDRALPAARPHGMALTAVHSGEPRHLETEVAHG